jgi:hypothetical protein
VLKGSNPALQFIITPLGLSLTRQREASLSSRSDARCCAVDIPPCPNVAGQNMDAWRSSLCRTKTPAIMCLQIAALSGPSGDSRSRSRADGNLISDNENGVIVLGPSFDRPPEEQVRPQRVGSSRFFLRAARRRGGEASEDDGCPGV